MAARIVLLGATGYTGRRAAEAMIARGLRPVLAGRRTGPLTALAERLGGLPTSTVDVTDPARVRTLVGPGDVLVSTVGPFLRLGEAALAAVVEAGARYLDSTGEPPFIRRVFEEFGPLAEQTDAALLTAFGNDFVPGNLAGALALREAGELADRLEIGYFLTGVGRGQAFSRGTLASLVGIVTEPVFSWRDGIRVEPPGARMRTFPVAGKDRPALSIGATEHYALPRLQPGLGEVDVYLGWFGPATRVAPVVSRGLGLATKVPGVRVLADWVGELATRRVAAEPDPAVLARSRSHFVGQAFAGDEMLAEVRLVAGDPYRLTAELLAWGAERVARHGVSGSGALGPVDAFGLDVLEAGCAEAGLVRAG